jgi:glycosyltransferase involved in cell wall biosynthesis
MQRIAIVTHSLRMGGLENVVFNLGKSFIQHNFDVEIIETFKEGEWKHYFLKNNLKVESITRKYYQSAFSHAKQIADYLKKFDIILLNEAPYARSVIGQLPQNIKVYPVLHMSLPSIAYNAVGCIKNWNKIIAVSPSLKNYILNEIKWLDENDVIIINNGIDLKEFTPVKKQTSKEKNIIYLGRLAEEKGILLLPEIVFKIIEDPLFNRLDVYGNGPLEKELEARINDLNLNNKIFLKGPVAHQQVKDIFANYDIILMPSYKEGLPIVLLEAMACGLVPIVARIEGSTDIVVTDKVNGYLCEKGKTEEFATTLKKVLKDDNLSGISMAAQATIAHNFSIEHMANSYLNLFDNNKSTMIVRNDKIDKSLLGDLPFLPYILIRPVRKVLKIMGLWKDI